MTQVVHLSVIRLETQFVFQEQTDRCRLPVYVSPPLS